MRCHASLCAQTTEAKCVQGRKDEKRALRLLPVGLLLGVARLLLPCWRVAWLLLLLARSRLARLARAWLSLLLAVHSCANGTRG